MLNRFVSQNFKVKFLSSSSSVSASASASHPLVATTSASSTTTTSTTTIVSSTSSTNSLSNNQTTKATVTINGNAFNKQGNCYIFGCASFSTLSTNNIFSPVVSDKLSVSINNSTNTTSSVKYSTSRKNSTSSSSTSSSASSAAINAITGSPIRALINDKMDKFPTKTVLTMLQQKLRWNVQDLKRHSEAYGTALRDLGYNVGDVIVLLLPCNAEFIAAQIGAACAGVKVVPINIYTATTEKVHEVLTKTKPKGLVFAQNPIDEKNRELLEIVQKLIPELDKSPIQLGKVLQSPKYPNLQFVSHTGFDRKRGIYRYRDLMMYNPVWDLLSEGESSITPQTPWLINPDDYSEITQEKFIEIAKKATTSLQVQQDNHILLNANNNIRTTAGLIGTFVALNQASHLVIPSCSFNETANASAVKEYGSLLNLGIGDVTQTGIKTWWEKSL